MIYSRITDGRRFDPVGEAWTSWTPRTDNREWSTYLNALAADADRRAAELGRETAAERPAWAIEALGPVPAEPGPARDEWEQQAGLVASYRELRGHDDDAEVLGPAPKPGQVEAYAAYRAAWRALGRPETEREETEMSDGQLRMRVRAWEREQAWGPRYVGNELAGTHQAAATHRHNAALRAAEAAATPDAEQRAELERAAVQAAALADTLDARAAELQLLDDARARFLVHTAWTRGAADRSKAELAVRHADDAEPEERVTAEEWLDAHRGATVEDDQHRDITEADVVDDHADEQAPTDDVTETNAPDIREAATAEPPQRGEDAVRVPTAAETADSIERAERSLAEIAARNAADVQEVEQQRAEELTRWHAADEAAREEAAADYDDVDDYAAAVDPADAL